MLPLAAFPIHCYPAAWCNPILPFDANLPINRPELRKFGKCLGPTCSLSGLVILRNRGKAEIVDCYGVYGE